LTVPVSAPPYSANTLQEIAVAFHDRHQQTYGHDNRTEPVQIVNVRLSAIGEIPSIMISDKTGDAGADPVKSRRSLWFRDTGAVEADILDRAMMPTDFTALGPAVIESIESTILVRPGWQATMDGNGFIIMSPIEARANEKAST